MRSSIIASSLWFAIAAIVMRMSPLSSTHLLVSSSSSGRTTLSIIHPLVTFQHPSRSYVALRHAKAVHYNNAFVGHHSSPLIARDASITNGNEYNNRGIFNNNIASRAIGVDMSLQIQRKQSSSFIATSSTSDEEEVRGHVIRTAVRPYQLPEGSLPSSRYYTTRKESVPMIVATEAGALGDYNHYRSVALQSTFNRAISILTTDVNSYVRNLDEGYFATIGFRDGDLGENILVDGVDFTFFQVGMQYRFLSSASSSVGIPTSEDVVVEITEKIEPCMNLCKLSYIKSEGRCKYLIEALAEKDGLRGWYAKVIQGGIIQVGDSLSTAIAMA